MDGSRIRKEKVADLKISGYVWTGPKKGTKLALFKVTRSANHKLHANKLF